MKKIIQTVVAMAVIASMTGCVSPSMIDRKRDAADIFTATLGGGIGVKGRIGPIQTGLLAEQDSIGLRGGAYRCSMPNGGQTSIGVFDMQAVLFGSEEFYMDHADVSWDREKWFVSDSILFLAPRGDWYSWPWKLNPYYTEIEVVGGFLLTVRLGFNPGELLDFLLGWVGIDIYGDDLEAKKVKEESSKSSDARSPKRAAPQ